MLLLTVLFGSVVVLVGPVVELTVPVVVVVLTVCKNLLDYSYALMEDRVRIRVTTKNKK